MFYISSENNARFLAKIGVIIVSSFLQPNLFMFCLFQSRYLPMRPEVLNGSGGLTQGDDGGASARQRRSQPAALSGIGAAFDRCGH